VFLRIDKLQIELPRPQQADPASAGIVQELLGGKFGEMSTLMNYTYHSRSTCGARARSGPTTTSSPTSPPRSWAT
jgi:Mn-containing catalase